LATPDSIVANIGLHALAGCAASAVQGMGCGGGAVGAATSAILAPLIRDAQYSGEQTTTVTDNGNGTATFTSTYGNPVYNMVTTALATLAGGAAANALGYNAQAGANAGQNEALNNATKNKTLILSPGDFALSALQDMRDLPNAVRSFLSTPQHSAGNSNTDPNNQLSGNNSNNLPPTAGAVATPWAMACTPNGPCVPIPAIVSPGSPGLPSNAIASSNDGTSGASSNNGGSTAGSVGAADGGIPSRVQTRINVTNDGLTHIGDRHLDPTVNASQFTISESDLTNLLQSPNTVSTPVTRTLQSGTSINYVREVNVGQVIGTDKFNNYQPTSTMTVITDKYGNLVTAFPGKLK
jgi:filamentous hemagglutinin